MEAATKELALGLCRGLAFSVTAVGDRLGPDGVWTAWKGSGHPALGLVGRADPRDHPAAVPRACRALGQRTPCILVGHVFIQVPLSPQRAGERRKESKQKGTHTDRKCARVRPLCTDLERSSGHHFGSRETGSERPA